ncbi:MAG: hypothetical protein OER88_04475 [Planctomycetota bacterium]|nr:hypothetical protein [Planctomycetota bacterium]
MAFGKPKSNKIRTEHLPGPIATSYRRIFTRHEPDVERLMFILDTAEITARFLSAVVLTMLRELVQSGKLEAPLIDLGDASKRLKKPSFGLWMEILREGARRLHGQAALFDDDAAQSLATAVCAFVFNDKRKTKDRPYADLDAIVVIRNKVHHPAEELDIPALCEEAEALINRALEQLDFFEHYPPYVVRQIHVRRHRLSEPGYQHQCFLLQGEIDFPTAEKDDRTWFTETNEVLLYRSETSYLNLDPLFVYIHADEIDKSKIGSNKQSAELYPGMYCFAGFASKASGLVVDYLPCASSSKSFRTSNEAFRDPDLTSFLNKGVSELLTLLGAAPAAETGDAS